MACEFRIIEIQQGSLKRSVRLIVDEGGLASGNQENALNSLDCSCRKMVLEHGYVGVGRKVTNPQCVPCLLWFWRWSMETYTLDILRHGTLAAGS